MYHEANKMLESAESFADAEENELRISAFRSRKWKALAALTVLCAFLGLLLYYIGDNVQWFRKAAKIEISGAQSDLNVVDVEKTTGDQTESTEALRTETQPAREEILIEPNEASAKTGKIDHAGRKLRGYRATRDPKTGKIVTTPVYEDEEKK
jgi:hypothetical protein